MKTKKLRLLFLVGSCALLLASGTALAHDRDDNPPGPIGGPGTNWENPPGPMGGPGMSPDRTWPYVQPVHHRGWRPLRHLHRHLHGHGHRHGRRHWHGGRHGYWHWH